MSDIKKYLPLFTGYFATFFLAEFCHYIFWGKYFFYLINSLIMSLLITYWSFSQGVYTPDKTSRKLRLKIGAVMVLWFFFKCCRDRFLMENDALVRFSWYSYYISIVLLPLFCYEFSLYFSSPVAKTGKMNLKALTVLASILIALTLTNDIHQLAFRFPGGPDSWHESYTRGPIYYLVSTYTLLLYILTARNILRQCTLPKSKQYIWLPTLPIVILITYTVLYFFNLDPHLNGIRLFGLTDVFCFIVIVFVDACGLVYRNATKMPNEESFILHKIWEKIEGRMNKARELLEGDEGKSEEDFRRDLFHYGIIQTYNKKVANLILLGRQRGRIDYSELCLSFAESVEYLKLRGITSALAAEGEGRFSIGEMLNVYTEFEDKIEEILPDLDAILVVLEAGDNKLELRILAEDKEGNAL